MLKKTISYTDFNGDEVSEDFFFHQSKAELIELEVSHEGGLEEAIKRIVKAEDGKAIIAEFKNIILSSYGQRSLDGKRFIKNQTIRDEFESTEAYSTLFMELVTDAQAAATFIQGVIPQDMAAEAAKVAASAPVLVQMPAEEAPEIERPETTTLQSITKADLMVLPREEFLLMQERIRNGEVLVVD